MHGFHCLSWQGNSGSILGYYCTRFRLTTFKMWPWTYQRLQNVDDLKKETDFKTYGLNFFLSISLSQILNCRYKEHCKISYCLTFIQRSYRPSNASIVYNILKPHLSHASSIKNMSTCKCWLFIIEFCDSCN